MYCLISDTSDPYFNLALEEVLLKNRKEDYLILGSNSSSVIIGKHQVAHTEVNSGFVHKKNIPVIRRITGGGAVFHDAGNLNFTFIKQSEQGKQVNFQEYTRPVIEFLATLGLDARFEGKNDLKIDGLKISGNAEHVFRNRVLHHGTLLFNASLDLLRNCLRKDVSCYRSRAVGSNPSPVANLRTLLPGIETTGKFRAQMFDFMNGYFEDAETYVLTDADKAEVMLLADSKYNSWEWNYAYGPEYSFDNKFIYHNINVSCRLFVKEGTIREIILKGSPDVEPLAEKLKGRRHMPDEMGSILNNEGFDDLDIFNFF